MKKTKILAIVLATLLAASALAACGSSSSSSSASSSGSSSTSTDSGSSEASASVAEDEKTFNIDLATSYAADGPAGLALAQFVEDVKEQSGGTINISLFTDGTLGTTNDNYASVASGDLDMTMSGLEGLDLYAPEYTFLDCPFLIKDMDHLKALLASGIGDTLKERYEENGFVTLGWHYRSIRQMYSNKKVTTPADLVGLKLRLPGQTVYVDAWSKLGVSTTTVSMNELYTALQTNVAEACDGGYEQTVTLKLYEVQDYIIETSHVYEFVGLYINKDLYESMSENQRQILSSCAEKSLADADQMMLDTDEDYKQICIDGGMELVEVDTDLFNEALTDHYKDQFETKWTVSTYDEVMGYAN